MEYTHRGKEISTGDVQTVCGLTISKWSPNTVNVISTRFNPYDIRREITCLNCNRIEDLKIGKIRRKV